MKYNSTIELLKHKSKVRKIENLKNGDLIKVKSDYHPFVFHYGLIEKSNDGLYIIHNHPDKTNSKGGNTVREPFQDWIKGKEILSIESTNIDLNQIKDIYNSLKPFKYDFFNYNCEHFVNFVKDKNYLSPQIIRFTSVVVVGLLFYYFYKRKR
jgi:hypothetical protein